MKEDKDFYIKITWNVQDVFDKAEEMEVTVTIEQAVALLKKIENNWDAEYGVSWADIEAGIDDII